MMIENNRYEITQDKSIQKYRINVLKSNIKKHEKYFNAFRKIIIFLSVFIIINAAFNIIYFYIYNSNIFSLALSLFSLILLLIPVFYMRNVEFYNYPTLNCASCNSNIFLNVFWYCAKCGTENNNSTFIEDLALIRNKRRFPTMCTPIDPCGTCGIQPPAIVCGNCKNVIVTDLENLEKNGDYIIELTNLRQSENPKPEPESKTPTSPLDDDLI